MKSKTTQELNEELFNAIQNNDLIQVKKLIEQEGANIHAYDDYPLRWCVQNGQLEIMKCLLEHDADINIGLIEAAKNGHLEIMKYLLKNGADINMGLSEAAKNDHLDIVEILVENGADINIGLIEAAKSGNLKIFKYLVKQGVNIHAQNSLALREGNLEIFKCLVGRPTAYINVPNGLALNGLALREAVKNGKFDIIKYMIEQGADIHENNDEILRLCIDSYNTQMIEYIINECSNTEQFFKIISESSDSDINRMKNIVQEEVIEQEKNDLWFRVSASMGNLKVVQFLCALRTEVKVSSQRSFTYHKGNGEWVEKKNPTWSKSFIPKINIHMNKDMALRMSSKYGHLEVVKYLVEQGADIHANNDRALREAAKNGHLEVVKYMVIDCNMKIDKELKTYLQEQNLTDTISIIEKRSFTDKIKALRDPSISNVSDCIVQKVL